MIEIKNFTKEINIRSIGVYIITHENSSLKYVGSTYQKYGFKQRWLQHLNGFNNNKGNKVLLNIYHKYGIKGFKFKILEEIKDKKIIRKRELYWINYYNTYYNGANCSLDTENGLLGRKTSPLTAKHKEKLRLISKTKKITYLYNSKGDLIKVFPSSVSCDRHFNLKKGSTSYIISSKSNQKRISKKYFPSYKRIKKEDWKMTFGHTKDSYKKMGLKHKGKIITQATRDKMRKSSKKSKNVKLITVKDNKIIKIFDSLNQCDDFLNLTRGSSSKLLKGKCKTLKNRKYIVKLTS